MSSHPILEVQPGVSVGDRTWDGPLGLPRRRDETGGELSRRLDGEVLPVLLLPLAEEHPGTLHRLQGLLHVGQHGVVGQVHLHQRRRLAYPLHLHLNDAVVVGVEVGQLGHFEGDPRQGDEGVVADVEGVQLREVAQLVWQFAHLVVGHVELCDEAELDCELGRQLGDDVPRQVAGRERRVAHEVIHGVGHLHQLALGQVQIAVFLRLIAPAHHSDDGPARHHDRQLLRHVGDVHTEARWRAHLAVLLTPAATSTTLCLSLTPTVTPSLMIIQSRRA